jgi:histone-lysine N-methyltransferase SUV39H
VIDNSQRAFTQSAATEELLSRFIQPIPATGASVSERATTAKKPVQKEYRRQLLAELEKDTSVVYSRASSVEALFGPHGFSAMYSTDGDNAMRKRKAQPKAKKIRRRDVKLEWSSPDTLPQEPFDPEKLLPPSQQAHMVLSSKFDDAIEPPITFLNELNDRQLSGKYQFISSYIRRPGVEAAPAEGTGYGCHCIGGCMPDSCDCLIDDIEVDDFGDEIDRGKLVPYKRVHTATGKTMSVLRNEYLKSYVEGEKQEIIECNRSCGCGQDCWNRVVQKGRTLPLEIFMTPKCGFGESHQYSFFQLH